MVEALNKFRLFLLQTQSNWFVDSASPWYIYPTFTRMWLTMALKNKINLTTDFIHHRQSASEHLLCFRSVGPLFVWRTNCNATWLELKDL